MTKDEALRLALSTLNEVRDETFRLLRNGERLYSETKVWDTIYEIKKALETKDEPVAWEQFHEHMAGPNYNEKGELDTRLRVDPVTGDVGIGTPQRTWVGMTDEEKAQFVVAYYPSNWDRKTAVSLMNDYEKYLKEKNNV